MAEDCHFPVMWINDAQTFLIGRQVATSARVNEKSAREEMHLPILIGRFDADTFDRMIEFLNRPSLAYLSARFLGVFQQDLIELRAFDLNRLGLTRELPLPKDKVYRSGPVAEMELGAKFFRKTGVLYRRQYAHFLKNPPVVWEQRFADMKAREMFLLEQKSAFAGTGQECRRRAATRTTSNNQRVIRDRIHTDQEDQHSFSARTSPSREAATQRQKNLDGVWTLSRRGRVFGSCRGQLLHCCDHGIDTFQNLFRGRR